MSTLLLVAALLAVGPNDAVARPAAVGVERPQALPGGVLAQRGRGRGAQPGMGMAGGLRGQQPADYDAGNDLAEVIQTAIAPNSWERNGGPGTIRYWRPRRAMVIRASGGAHDHVGELLEQMNRLGQ
jgi:hypothetical protein